MGSQNKITFYDIPGQSPSSKSWSVNMWKSRYALNFKHIPYETRWIFYPDIKPHFKSIGMAPSEVFPDGEEYYSCPSIEVSKAGGKPDLITDSLKIAEYLEELYPDRPLFPNGTKSLQLVFMDMVDKKIANPIFMPALWLSFKQLTPESIDYWRRTREARYGPLEKLSPQGPVRDEQLAKAKQSFNELAPYVSKKSGGAGIFLTGEEPVYADLYLAAVLKWMKVVGEKELWSHVKEWNDGIWAKISDAVDEKYSQVV